MIPPRPFRHMGISMVCASEADFGDEFRMALVAHQARSAGKGITRITRDKKMLTLFPAASRR